MGVYLLSCDEQQANALWLRWLQSEPVSSDIAVLSTHSTPVGSESDPHTFFSIQLIPKKGLRIGCIVIFLFGLALCELLTHAFPPLWTAAIRDTGLFPDILSVFLLMLWFILAFSPTIILGIYYSLFRREEAHFFKEVERSGVDIHPVVPTVAWVLFPKDMLIIQLSVFAVFIPRFLTLVNLWNAISLFSPLLLLMLLWMVPYELVDLSRIYANKKEHKTVSVLTYWKLELLEKSRRICVLFYLPPFFYCLIYFCTQLYIAAVSHPLSISNRDNLSLSSVVRLLAALSASKGLGNIGIRDGDYILNYTINHYVVLSQSLGFLMVVVTLSIFYFNIRLLKSRSFFKKDFWYDQKFHPALVPSPVAHKSYARAANIHIVLSSLLLFWSVGICTVLLVFAILSMSDVHIGWLPLGWVVPLVWYRSVVGMWVGGFLSNVFLIGVFASTLLWLLMWLYSLVNTSWRSLSVLRDYTGRHHKAKAILRGLCRQQKISSPLLHIDGGSAGWPMTTSLLPASRFCVVHLSGTLAEELNDEQLTLVLAHELAHVTLHARKLWLIQLISRMSVLGAGHLTLLLDYWKMELEADDFAVRVTGNRDALVELLEKLPQIEFDAELRLRAARNSSANSVLNVSRSLVLDGVRLLQKPLSFVPKRLGGGRLVSGVTELYKFHFGVSLWGALHPPYEVRAATLGSQHLLFGLVGDEDDDDEPILSDAPSVTIQQVGEQKVATILGGIPAPSKHIYWEGSQEVTQKGIDDTHAHTQEEYDQENDQVSKDSIQEEIIRNHEAALTHPTATLPKIPLPILHYVNHELFQLQETIAKNYKKGHVRDLTQYTATMARLKRYQQIQEELANNHYQSIAIELHNECRQYEDNLTALQQQLRPRGQMPDDAHYFKLKDDILAAERALTQVAGDIDQESKTSIVNKIMASKHAQSETVRGRLMLQIIKTQEHINQLKSLQQLLTPLEKSSVEQEKKRSPSYTNLLTEQAKQVLSIAKEEVEHFNHHHIGPEHLLLGLLRVDHGVASELLHRLGVELEDVVNTIEIIVGRGSDPSPSTIALSTRAKMVMGKTTVVALDLGHTYVDTEHILMGLLEEGGNIAVGILVSLAIDLEQAKQVTMAALKERNL